MVTREQAEAIADEWIAAWNAHDVPRVLSHYLDDFEMQSPKIAAVAGEPTGVLRGKPAIEAYWRKAMAMAPGLRFEKLGVFVGAQSVAIHYRNHQDKLVVEVLELDAAGKVHRGAAHYM
ncbi:MAG: nuclear transport factor 2 family protein [Deltaproteobacteria bacterium]|nr:nuclear transport factor 2 family protein [Deltaproteobacteria bacterium]